MKDFQPGVTASPFHVNCRSTTAPYFDENFGEIGKRAARDEKGKTYYVPESMNYPEWKKVFVDKTMTYEDWEKKYKFNKRRTYERHTEEEIHDCENAVEFPVKGKITFNHFFFTYPESKSETLEDINITIEPGETVGIIGKIGSGKSTLVNSLLRLYNVSPRSILIDDVDIMDMKIKCVRDNIAIVPQDNFLFSDTIERNINFADRTRNLDDAIEAAQFADVHDNIVEFKDKYNTISGERGVTLSGGQKQRISLARAYAKDAPILILDDSVSAVDLKTEEKILKNIKEKRAGKTTLVIASRVSTVAHMDKIIVINEGKVEAFDSPKNLSKISPTYQKMVYLQRLEKEVGSVAPWKKI